MINWSPFLSIISLKHFILIPEIGHKTYSAFEQKQKILSAKHNRIVAFFVQQNLIVATTQYFFFFFYRCHTEFCYRCGGKYHHLKFVGNHYDRFSILGCKYNYKPDQPVQRIAVRGALFSGQVMVVPIIAGLAVTAGCAVLGAGIVAAPFYASYVLIRKQRAKRKRANIKKKK